MAKTYTPYSKKSGCKVEYDADTCYSLLHAMYHDSDPVYLRKYVDFCFDANRREGFAPRKPRHQDPSIRYHHLFPKCLVPSMANSPTNLVVLSRQEHFDAHCYLVFAFRDYYHSTDPKKSRIFCNLGVAVGATLGQLPRRKQAANRDWYASEFYTLTKKSIAGTDNKEMWRSYQSMMRSTPDGKAYDNLKGYLRYISDKYDVHFPEDTGVVERARSLVSCSVMPIPTEVLKKLQDKYDVYLKSLQSESAYHKVTESVVRLD